MAVGFHMKKKVSLKSTIGRRNERIVGVFNVKESDGESFARVKELDCLSNYSVKGRNLGSNTKQRKKRIEREGIIYSDIPRWRMRRADASRDAVEGSKSMARGQKEWVKNVRAAKSGEASDSRMFPLKPTKAKQKLFDGNVSDYDQSSKEPGGFYRSKDRRMKAEASSLSIILKGRKQDMELDSEDEKLDKHSMKKGREIQVCEQNSVRCPTRVLDKTGKKRRFQTNPLENGSTETSAPKKKHKRVIKIDPFDVSNKRLEDSVCKSDVAVEKVIVSKNAQFRAIQPNDKILSFVEDNLLGRRRLIELQNVGYNVKLSAPLDNIPFSTSTEKEKIEENVFRNKLEFFAAAKISSSFPPPTIPEIAFAGRSNVGKSSLLNALTRQWGVVRTSDKPGLTQTINFFKLASKLCLVDLPGYGFAYAKEELKEAWEELVKEYVSTRVGLQRVCLLVDTKWGMKSRDLELIDLMERSRTPYQIILTKTDVVFPIDVARRAMEVQENLKQNKSIVDPVMMVSSKSGAGIRYLRSVLAKIARFVKP